MKRIKAFLLVATATVVAPACDPGVDGPGDGSGDGSGSGSGSATDDWDAKLGQREYDYSAALRIAALRLTGDLPTMTEINSVANATDLAGKKSAYENLVTDYLARPTFNRQMVYYFRDLFRMGGTLGAVDLETVPAFAAQLASTNDSYMKLLTQSTNTCPTYNMATNTFTAGNCANGVTTHSGVLTNPGFLAQFNSNFNFRVARAVQETFNCAKHPAEFRDVPETREGKQYTSAFSWDALGALTNGGRFDFHDTEGVVCANCHGSLNHVTPLWANFNPMGQLQANIVVKTPLAPPNDVARLTDYLVTGTAYAYRNGKATPDLPSLGNAMAADPEVHACAVKRFWNWSMGHTDIVNDAKLVPNAVIQTQVDAFVANGFKIKDLIRSIMLSDDFTKF